MEAEELNAQLQAATQFIINSKTESENFKEGGEKFKEGAELYKKISEKTIEIFNDSFPKSISAEITEESLKKIENVIETAAKRFGTPLQCQVSDYDESKNSPQNEIRSKRFNIGVFKKYASNETNRKMMCWLGGITSIYSIEYVLFLFTYLGIIKWDMKVIFLIFGITFGILLIAFVTRVYYLFHNKKKKVSENS